MPSPCRAQPARRPIRSTRSRSRTRTRAGSSRAGSRAGAPRTPSGCSRRTTPRRRSSCGRSASCASSSRRCSRARASHVEDVAARRATAFASPAGVSLTELGAFRQGLFFVQDPACDARDAVRRDRAGQHASPTCARRPAARRSSCRARRGTVIAADRSLARLERMRRTCDALDARNVMPLVADAREPGARAGGRGAGRRAVHRHRHVPPPPRRALASPGLRPRGDGRAAAAILRAAADARARRAGCSSTAPARSSPRRTTRRSSASSPSNSGLVARAAAGGRGARGRARRRTAARAAAAARRRRRVRGAPAADARVSWRGALAPRCLPYAMVAAVGFLLAYLVVAFLVFPARDRSRRRQGARRSSGCSYDEAVTRLAAAASRRSAAKNAFVRRVAPKRTVLAQSPAAGSQRAARHRDPARRQRRASGSCRCPAVVGLTQALAQDAIEKAGLEVGDVTERREPVRARPVLEANPVGGHGQCRRRRASISSSAAGRRQSRCPGRRRPVATAPRASMLEQVGLRARRRARPTRSRLGMPQHRHRAGRPPPVRRLAPGTRVSLAIVP